MKAGKPQRYSWKSIGAVFLGMLAIFVLSLGIDQLLHVLEVYPPWGRPMHDPALNFLALSYRIPIGILGSYIAARLAPHNPMGHALALGVIGLVLSTMGAVAAIPLELGPAWYPISLILTALPCAWVGGLLQRREEGVRQ